MKRKVALLVAAIMLLSMLPVNVFGAQIIEHPTHGFAADGPEGLQWVTVRIPLASIAADMRYSGNDEFGVILGFDMDVATQNRYDYAMFGHAGGWDGNGVWTRYDFLPNITTDWNHTLEDLGALATPGAFSLGVPIPARYDLGPIFNSAANRSAHDNVPAIDRGRVNSRDAWVAGVGWPNPYRVHEVRVPLYFDAAASGVGALEAANLVEWGITGHVDISFEVQIARGAMPTLGVYLITQGGVRRNLLTGARIVDAGAANPGVTFEVYGDAMAFESGLILPRIDITERAPGSMTFDPANPWVNDAPNHSTTGYRTVRLVAPYDYVWNIGIPGHLMAPGTESLDNVRLIPRNAAFHGGPVQAARIRSGFVSEFANPAMRLPIPGTITTAAEHPFYVYGGGGTPGGPTHGRSTGISAVTGDRRMWIEIDFRVGTEDGTIWRNTIDAAAANLNGVMRLQGLALIPNPRAAEEGSVNIDISWGPARGEPMNIGWGMGAGTLLEGAAAVMHVPIVRHARDRWVRMDMEVGIRRGVALELGVGGATPTIISGLMGWRLDGQMNGPSPSIAQTGIQPTMRPQQIQGAGAVFFSGPGTPHTIRTARVQVQELVAGALDTGFLNSQIDFEIPEGAQIVHAAWALHDGDNRITAGEVDWTPIPAGIWQGHFGGVYSNWDPATNVFWGGVPYMTEDYLRLFLPRIAAPTSLRTLEVYFWMSIEAGFEAKYGDELVFAVSGSAVDRLEEDNTEVVVAFIEDPVAVELDGDLIQVESGRTHNLMEMTSIGDLVISEATHGRLRAGDEIWIYVQGTNIQRPHTLQFHTDNNAVIEEGNIMLSPARQLRRTLPGGLEVTGVFFRVDRASTSGEESVIRLTNNYLFGEILPGQDYKIVVSGPRLAANEYQIAARAGQVNIDPVYFVQQVENPNFGNQDWRPFNPDNIIAGLVPGVSQGTIDAMYALITAHGPLNTGHGWFNWDNEWTTSAARQGLIDDLDLEIGAWVNGVAVTGWNHVPANTPDLRGTWHNQGNGEWRAEEFLAGTDNRPTIGEVVRLLAGQAQVNAVTPDTLGVFNSFPYAVQVIEWIGYDDAAIYGPGGLLGGGPVTFHVNWPVDGITPVVFHSFSPQFATALLSPRVFANHYGLDYYWDDAARTFTFSGTSRTGEAVSVALTLGSTDAVVNGRTVDIATAVGQTQLAGLIAPHVVADRQYVPARFLADAFGIPITHVVVGTSITLG